MDHGKRIKVSQKATSGQQVVSFFGACGTFVVVLGTYTRT
jgi:hypothetical protein